MADSWCRYINKLTISLLILCGLTVSLFSQDKNIGGVVNVYRRVVAIGPGANNVTLNRVDSLAAGDTILLIQMQGVAIDPAIDPYGTAIANLLGTPGGYEFLLIQSINTGTKEVVFKNNILTSFDIRGNVQLVRVPYYNSATVTSTITARAWSFEEKVGGVVAMIVGRKLRLEADIDVSYKGFYGGKDTIGLGLCVESNPLYAEDAYPRNWLNAGYKGEGLATHDDLLAPLYPSLSKGQGRNFTGGGGGNGKFAGGGGGSNWGTGGEGTPEKFSECPGTLYGGAGGSSINNPFILSGIFMGGGGGSSTHYAGSSESHGGRGGGIVIIIADTLSGNENSIKANGGSAPDAGNFGGGGGGGAGGSVIISSQSFTEDVKDSLKVSVKGGNGGASNGFYGNGGGGGGGIIWFNKAKPGKVLTNVMYGSGEIGSSGIVNNGFSPKLNGFLFNSIRSDVTLNQVDSICSNMPFDTISGTTPIGGLAPHTFLWESSTVSEIAGFAPAAGVNNAQDYSPDILTQTTWFRRTVTDANILEPLVDVSTAVKVIVQPFIKKNVVISSDTICFAQDPPAFTSKEPLQDGNGVYSFVWKVSLDDAVYTLPVNANNSEGYTPPPALEKTSWYKRIVTSGRCVDSTAIVKIEVLDTISKNKIISLPEEICFGTTFADLTGTTPTTGDVLGGGDESYRFLWETNVNGTGWTTAPGINNLSDYNPVEQIEGFPSNLNLFRRIVKSGSNDVCVDTSATVLLTDYAILRNNIVTPATQTICYNWAPAKLIGTVTPTLTGGNGTYTYVWEVSSVTVPAWTPVPGATGADYQPPKLFETTRYRRVVSSSLCSDISAPVIVNVDKPITNNIVSLAAGGADTTICNNNQISFLKGLTALGGDELTYSYKWVRSPDNATWTDVSAASALTNYNPPALTATTAPTDYYYKRKVTSGACIDTLSASGIKVTVLPVISNNNITPDKPKVCYGLAPAAPIAGLIPVSGGAGTGTYVYSWEQSTDGGTTWAPTAVVTDAFQPPALTVETQYKRKVVSGGFVCSSDISAPVTIEINPLPTATITSTSAMQICYPGTTIPIDINITGSASPWKVTLNENTTAGVVNNVTTNTATLTVTPTTSSGQASYNYNYTIGKVEDANGCLAISMGGSRVVDVYKTPVPEAGPNDVVCGQTYALKAIPTVGVGKWIFPPLVANTGTAANTTVTVPPFTGGSAEYWFVWEENNVICQAKDSVKIHFDKEISSINPAGDDTTLYNFVDIIFLNALPLQSGETGLWALEIGSGVPATPLSESTSISGLEKEIKNTFSWTITNGECELKDFIEITLRELVLPKGFSPNGDVNNYNNTYKIRGLDLQNQIAEFTIVNGAGSVVFSTSNRDGQIWSDWDGRDSKGKDVSEGTYYYQLRLTSAGSAGTGEIRKWSGFITLKR